MQQLHVQNGLEEVCLQEDMAHWNHARITPIPDGHVVLLRRLLADNRMMASVLSHAAQMVSGADSVFSNVVSLYSTAVYPAATLGSCWLSHISFER